MKRVNFQIKRQHGALTVEFVLAMVIAGAILAPVIPMILDMSKEVLAGFVERISPYWP